MILRERADERITFQLDVMRTVEYATRYSSPHSDYVTDSRSGHVELKDIIAG